MAAMRSNGFQRLSDGETTSALEHLAQIFAKKAGPYSEQINNLLRSHDYRSIARLVFDYEKFNGNAIEAYAARQTVALFQKWERLPGCKAAEAIEATVNSFITCERSNAIRNEQFSVFSNTGRGPSEWEPWIGPALTRAHEYCVRILGKLPEWSDLDYYFTTGANTNCRRNTSARWKLSTKLACSADLKDSVIELLEELPALVDSKTMYHSVSDEEDVGSFEFDIEPGRFGLVPKDAFRRRTIIVEPGLNTLGQRAYGRHIARRLSSFTFGWVDTRDQHPNRVMARGGSLGDGSATMDGSDASNRIPYEVVKFLLAGPGHSFLPHTRGGWDWFQRLAALRTGTVALSKEIQDYDLEMFSSMGNGYTFELETLLFLSLAWAACDVVEGLELRSLPERLKRHRSRRDVRVYGDDVIVPVSAFEHVRALLEASGQSINRAKSYASGPFRESCGADFLLGQNIRPFYVRENLRTTDLYALHNFMVRTGWTFEFPEVATWVLQRIEPSWHLWGPDGYGDGHLISDDPRLLKPLKRHIGWSGYTFRTVVNRGRRNIQPLPGDVVLPAYTIYARGDPEVIGDPYSVRGDTGIKVISIYTLRP